MFMGPTSSSETKGQQVQMMPNKVGGGGGRTGGSGGGPVGGESGLGVFVVVRFSQQGRR